MRLLIKSVHQLLSEHKYMKRYIPIYTQYDYVNQKRVLHLRRLDGVGSALPPLCC